MKNGRKADIDRPRRRCPKGCSLGIYHAGIAFLVLGIIISIAAITTLKLFYVDIYDHRRPTRFLNVRISIGLFSSASTVHWLTGNGADLVNQVYFNNANWLWARGLLITAILLALLAFLVHLLINTCATDRKWNNVLLELLCLLFAVGTFLAGLSLTEMQIQYLHDFGDDIFTNFLDVNGLLLPPSELDEPNKLNDAISEKSLSGNGPDQTVLTTGDFALSLSPPSCSFVLLIVANSCFMLALLTLLPYFVRLCERADKERRQLKKANLEENV